MVHHGAIELIFPRSLYSKPTESLNLVEGAVAVRKSNVDISTCFSFDHEPKSSTPYCRILETDQDTNLGGKHSLLTLEDVSNILSLALPPDISETNTTIGPHDTSIVEDELSILKRHSVVCHRRTPAAAYDFLPTEADEMSEPIYYVAHS